MGYTQGETREYALKSRPGVIAHVKTPTERDRRRIFAWMESAGEKAETFGALIAWQEKVVEAHVSKFSGEPLECRGRAITNGKDLAEYGETKDVAELAAEIVAEASLSAGEETPSGELSG